MGRVYRARDESLKRLVALKVVAENGKLGTDAVARLLREARAAAALEHPNAVAIHDVGEHDGAPYIAMELVVGKSLRAFVGGHAGLAKKVRWLADIARALGAAHRAGLVHRDVKPENVMVRDDGVVKVLDFGLARRADDETGEVASTAVARLTGDGVVAGTPMYMAPEQLEGKKLDGRADEFAWGVVAYELLAGMAPWKATAASALVAEIVTRDPPLVCERAPEVPRALANVIARAMKRSPSDRFATMEALIDALDAVHVPTHDEGERASTVLTRATPRRSRIAVAAIGVAAIALGAWGIARRARSVDAPASSASITSASASATASAPAAPYERPLPRTSSQAALADYIKGHRHLRDGLIAEGWMNLSRALKADPTLAAAHILELTFDGSDRQSAFRAAFALREMLDDRDRGVVAVAEMLYGASPDYVEAERRARELAAKYPRDAELLLVRVRVADEAGDARRGAELAIAAFDLDPTLPGALNDAANALEATGDAAAARAILTRCLDVAPNATACLTNLGVEDGKVGRCDLMERALVQRRDVSPYLYNITPWLAWALDARDAPVDDTIELLRRFKQGRVTSPYGPLYDDESDDELLMEAALAGMHGDFVAARARIAALPARADRGESITAIAAASDAILLEESGDAKHAGRVALEFLRRRSLHVGQWAHAVNLVAPFAVRGGAMSATDALALDFVFPAGRMKADDVATHRLLLRLALVGDRRSAESVLAEIGTRSPVIPDMRPEGQFVVENARFVAGDFDGAIAVGEPLVRNCIPSLHRLRALYILGRAREAKGDTPGACAEYARILARWGHAIPRSVTADETRAHASALHCPK
jgi:serine/threonine-protein kinase